MYRFKIRALHVTRKFSCKTEGDVVHFILNPDYASSITKVQSDIRKTLLLAAESGIEIDRVTPEILFKLVKAVNPRSTIDQLTAK